VNLRGQTTIICYFIDLDGEIHHYCAMDNFDRRILQVLQKNNRQTQGLLAEEVGLSPSAVRRRVDKLRADNIIVADVSLVNPAKTGITVITSIRFEKEDRKSYERFKKLMLDAPEVLQCYTVSGDVDFVIIAHLPSVEDYESWMEEYLLEEKYVQRAATNIVYSRIKYETALPVRLDGEK